MEPADILKHFNSDSYRSRGLVSEILSRRFDRVVVNSGLGDGAIISETHRTLYLRLKLETVPPGLPFFQLSSLVFLRRMILLPFSLFGVTKKRLPFGDRVIDKGMDLYCREKEAVRTELPWLFTQDFLAELRSLVAGGFLGDLEYDGATLRYETRKLPDNEQELHTIEQVVSTMFSLVTHMKESQRDPVRSVQRLYRLLNEEKILNNIRWDSASGTIPHPIYPHELVVFFTVLGQEYWTDPEYTEKNVAKWLEEPAVLEKLPREDVKAVCTYLVRQERFTDGFWEHAFKGGYVDALLRNPVF